MKLLKLQTSVIFAFIQPDFIAITCLIKILLLTWLTSANIFTFISIFAFSFFQNLFLLYCSPHFLYPDSCQLYKSLKLISLFCYPPPTSTAFAVILRLLCQSSKLHTSMYGFKASLIDTFFCRWGGSIVCNFTSTLPQLKAQ